MLGLTHGITTPLSQHAIFCLQIILEIQSITRPKAFAQKALRIAGSRLPEPHCTVTRQAVAQKPNR
jgi:ribosomal protein L16/L10AE